MLTADAEGKTISLPPANGPAIWLVLPGMAQFGKRSSGGTPSVSTAVRATFIIMARKL